MKKDDFVFDYAPLYDRLKNDKVLRRSAPTQNTVSSTYKSRVREVLLDAHGPYCWLCNRRIRGETPTLDHIVPRSRGGRNAIANLRLAHERCNWRRANGPVPELLLTKEMQVAAGPKDIAQDIGGPSQ